MPINPDQIPRHESIDHEHPTDAGMMDDDPRHVPGTDVWGDETLVRAVPGGFKLPPPAASHHDAPPSASRKAQEVSNKPDGE